MIILKLFFERYINSLFFCADINDWKRGNGTDALQGSTNASLIDDYITEYLQDPLGRVLANYRRGCIVKYASDQTVTVGAGEIVLADSVDGAKRMRANTASITLTMPTIGSSGDSLDTGDAVEGTYYVYAVADADENTFTGIISASADFPDGIDYAKKLTAFYYNASSEIVIGGKIIMWSGTVAAIPSGYLLCDGTNGTPDLTNRFVIGAGDKCDPGDYNTARITGTGTALSIPLTGSAGGTGGGVLLGTQNAINDYYALAYIMEA